MNTARTLALVSVLLVPAASSGGDAASARQRLEDARNNLTRAVERIKPDPPRNADLDAALAVVEALKEAINAGAEFEQSDLDYAKAALAARKELRSQREYIDARRAKVKVFDARRTIDAALNPFNERVIGLQGKEPAPQDFKDARSAAEALKKVIEEARPFGKQDPPFATYLTQADATVIKQLKAVDDRETALAVEKQKALIDAARPPLKEAVAALGKDATEAQFKAADKAAGELSRQLEEGKGIEAKVPRYKADADKARAELAAAKKKMDEVWSATGLLRLKAEIDPQYKDLLAAGKPVRGGKPTPEQLAEAKTAGIVVRKLLEKFQPDAERSQAFGAYLAQVKKDLLDIEGNIERRILAAAQAEVASAQKKIEMKAPTDEQFAELATACTVLEKTFEVIHKDEPTMEVPVATAQAQLMEARAIMATRRTAVDVERQKANVEEARKIATEAMTAIKVANVTKELIENAESSVKLIGTVLDQGKGLVEKDKGYAAYQREVNQRIKDMNEKIGQRKLALLGNDSKAALLEALAAAKAKIEIANKPEAKDSDIDTAQAAADALTKLFETQAPLEKQNPTYAAAALKIWNAEAYKIPERMELAKYARELRKKSGEQYAAGAQFIDTANAEPKLRNRKDLYDKASSMFRACQSETNTMLAQLPMLVKVQILVDGGLKPPREVSAMCSERADTAEQLQKDLTPLIKFDEGPKKAYEAAKGLLDKSKKNEALAQFEECFATGIILQNRNPEINDKQFQVAGGTMTLGEVIQECLKQKKALKGK